MEENKQANEAANAATTNEPVQPISSEQAAEVAGGDGSCSTVTVGSVTVPVINGSLTDTAMATYDAAVDVTSYAIERVVKSF